MHANIHDKPTQAAILLARTKRLQRERDARNAAWHRFQQAQPRPINTADLAVTVAIALIALYGLLANTGGVS